MWMVLGDVVKSCGGVKPRRDAVVGGSVDDAERSPQLLGD
jgi:hypothetical protein